MVKRIGIDIFIDIILALEQPIGITELVSRTRMDHRLTRRNIERLTKFGLVTENKSTRKISLTSEGATIYQILNRNISNE